MFRENLQGNLAQEGWNKHTGRERQRDTPKTYWGGRTHQLTQTGILNDQTRTHRRDQTKSQKEMKKTTFAFASHTKIQKNKHYNTIIDIADQFVMQKP